METGNRDNPPQEAVRRGLYLSRVGSFVLFPVLHHSYEFTVAAAEAFHEVHPSGVAVEYPQSLHHLILKGIRRLPKISILLFGGERNYIRIEPVDPFVEVSRLALERDLEVRCMDLAVSHYPEVRQAYPDTYAMKSLGHRTYCEMVLRKEIDLGLRQDEMRERAMAYHLENFKRDLQASGKLSAERPILVLCGISHLKGLEMELLNAQAQPFEPAVTSKLYHLSSKSLGEIMGCFPFFSAVYESKRRGTRNEAQEEVIAVSTKDNEEREDLVLVEGKPRESLEDFVLRAHADVAFHSQEDRYDLLSRFALWCRSYYEHEIGDTISPHQVFLLDRFARKYAHIKGMLLPDFYELLISARGAISSHFCYRMWEIGTEYPAQKGPTELEIIELRAEDIFPFVEKVRMNPHAPLRPRAGVPRFLRRSEKQRKPKDTKFEFQPFSICSYQPEDIIIENYGKYLRTKGKSILSEERKRVLPFETSLLDGIDLRETIRNWHTGKIFVQENRTIRGGVDSLVVVYDDEDSKYPYTMTWLGEHYQESDMAFYATEPEERTVGPGIRKAVYGGFLMTMPPGRLFDVFHDPAYQMAENYAERLLLAGIDYGVERFVLYAAPKPPRPIFQVIAGRYGKRVLYIPMAQLSPVMLQKIRTFHILADKSVREYAGDYIW